MKISKNIMINCAEATLLIEKQLLLPLESKQRLLLALHLPLCKACKRYKVQSALIHRILESYSNKEGSKVIISDEIFRAKIKAKVYSK